MSWLDASTETKPLPQPGQSNRSPSRIFTPGGTNLPEAPNDAELARLHNALNTNPAIRDLYYASFTGRTTIDRTPRDFQADNRSVLQALEQQLRQHYRDHEFWIVNVPSSAEAVGHHRAWDGRDGFLVEPEYRARLRAAYLLLISGVAQYMFISGGKVDETQPLHVDALAGYQHVLDTYEAHWNRVVRPHSGDELRSRLLVDPFAIHSETNIRNCDRLCAHLGLDRNLIATTFGDPDHPPPPPPTAWTNDHGYGQGDYFSQGSGPGFVLRLRYFFQMFYMPGSFDQLPTNLAADHSSCAQGTGIFGDGLNDYRSDSALQWIGFTPMDPSPLPVNVRTWKTGVILHYKLHTFFLLHDNRRG